MVSMLEQKVTNCTEVPECDINDSFKVCWLSFGLKIGAKICFIDHELVLGCGNNSCSIFSFSDEVLHHLEKMLFLQRCDLRTHHHVGDVGKCDERLDHCLVSHNFSQGFTSEDNNIPVVLDLIFYQNFMVSLFILKQLLDLIGKILLPLWLHVLNFRSLIRGRDIFNQVFILLVLRLLRLLFHSLCHCF